MSRNSFFCRCILWLLLTRLASLDVKNIDSFRYCLSIFACFLPICIEINVDTAARFVPCEYMFLRYSF